MDTTFHADMKTAVQEIEEKQGFGETLRRSMEIDAESTFYIKAIRESILDYLIHNLDKEKCEDCFSEAAVAILVKHSAIMLMVLE